LGYSDAAIFYRHALDFIPVDILGSKTHNVAKINSIPGLMKNED